MVKDKQDRRSHCPWMVYIWFIYSLTHLLIHLFNKFTKHDWKQLDTVMHFVMHTWEEHSSTEITEDKYFYLLFEEKYNRMSVL